MSFSNDGAIVPESRASTCRGRSGITGKLMQLVGSWLLSSVLLRLLSLPLTKAAGPAG